MCCTQAGHWQSPRVVLEVDPDQASAGDFLLSEGFGGNYFKNNARQLVMAASRAAYEPSSRRGKP